MNEAERGIAAYKATAQKLKKPAKRKRTASPETDSEVQVRTSGSNASGTVPATTRSIRQPSEEAGARGANQANDNKNDAIRQLVREEAEKKGYRKIAKFLLLLGKQSAAEVLGNFDKVEIERISQEIAKINEVDQAEAKALLEEFGESGKRLHPVETGPRAAQSILTAAFGEKRAKQILYRVVPEARERPFRFLDDIDHEQILLLLKNESAPTLSIVLPYLQPLKASRILSSLPADLQGEVIRRIAKMKKIDADVIVRIETALKEHIRTQGRMITEEIDGREALANILKHMDYAGEEKILSELASSDPDLSQNVKDRLFTIDLIFKVDDADLQAVLRDYDDQEIAVILKGKDSEIQERLLSNLSSRRQAIVGEESSTLGKMRKSEVDGATKDFVDYLVELDEQRKITIHWDDRVI